MDNSTREEWDNKIATLKSRQLRNDQASNLMARVHVSHIVVRVTCGRNTILHLAAKNGKEDIVRLMAKRFPQLITRENITKDTALHSAARNKNSKNLLRMKNEIGNTALHEAVITGKYQAVHDLFKEDNEVANYLNKEGTSPLYLAVETEQHGIVALLLEAALLQNRERHQGTSPLHAAIMVMNSGGKIKHEHRCVLTFGDIDKATSLRSTSSDSSADQKGRTALHFAASVGNLEVVRIILKACTQSALEWDLKGNLPIHIACKKGHVNVDKELLWFDPKELLNQKGQNLLHIAAKRGKERVAEYILNEDRLEQLLNDKDNNGNTPLHLASKYLHPKILHLLKQKKRLKVNPLNNKGMTARDFVVLKRSTPPTLREFLSFAVLKSRGTRSSEKGRKAKHLLAEPPQIKWIKDRVNFMLLVAILIATVTFTAGFTVPGGVNSSDDKGTEKIGMATFLNRKKFQLFTICDAIAMYSSTLWSSILLWAHLGDFHLASSATYFASYLVGFALITMSVAFMAALHLAVTNVSWLADTLITIGVIFLLILLGVFVFLVFPLGERSLFLGRISDFIFKMVIHFSGSYGKLRKVKHKKKKASKETKKEGMESWRRRHWKRGRQR